MFVLVLLVCPSVCLSVCSPPLECKDATLMGKLYKSDDIQGGQVRRSGDYLLIR